MKKVSSILLLSALCICVGTAVAYYNTSSFGYDDANILTVNDDSVQILYFEIRYQDVEDFVDVLKENAPDKLITVSYFNR